MAETRQIGATGVVRARWIARPSRIRHEGYFAGGVRCGSGVAGQGGAAERAGGRGRGSSAGEPRGGAGQCRRHGAWWRGSGGGLAARGCDRLHDCDLGDLVEHCVPRLHWCFSGVTIKLQQFCDCRIQQGYMTDVGDHFTPGLHCEYCDCRIQWGVSGEDKRATQKSRHETR
ncbi:uncharacterized protein [Triticum aestivum]|uniref:uncharacterized protein isoform X1 n=1 Tax=Triticum aestivum TaxID=4565 RepID=UPI001ABC8E13|nr:uncharacterized protein LOC109734117 isoform X2 [Aegilops tauschii subsp. strangulata]XP_044448182.1 uncharacterized protein LOC123180252 isoform X1 [Triticum aestivum]